MLTFWRFSIASFANSITSVIFIVLVKISIYDIKFTDNLPVKGIRNIPQPDTIIPNIFAQIPPSSISTLPTKQTMPIRNNTTPQQCFGYAKTCRDIQCAFKEFNFICDNDHDVPICKYKKKKNFFF